MIGYILVRALTPRRRRYVRRRYPVCVVPWWVVLTFGAPSVAYLAVVSNLGPVGACVTVAVFGLVMLVLKRRYDPKQGPVPPTTTRRIGPLR